MMRYAPGSGASWPAGLLLAALAACQRPPVGQPPQTTAPAAIATGVMTKSAYEHPYYPLRRGWTWEYETAQEHASVDMREPVRSRDQVLTVRSEPGRLLALVETRYSYSDAASAQMHVAVTAQGVSPDIGTLQTAAATVTTESSEGLFLPRELRTGQTWSYALQLRSGLQDSSVTAQLEVVSPEQVVEVPAGRFVTVHVRSELRNRMRSKGAQLAPLAIEIPEVAHVQHDDLYYARGVGLVKAVTTTPEGYRSIKVLTRFSPGQ